MVRNCTILLYFKKIYIKYKNRPPFFVYIFFEMFISALFLGLFGCGVSWLAGDSPPLTPGLGLDSGTLFARPGGYISGKCCGVILLQACLEY